MFIFAQAKKDTHKVTDIRQSLFDSEIEFEQLVKLQNEVYRKRNLRFSAESFKHWYVDNPCGRVISFNAFNGEDMVAHHACIPTKMVFGDEIITGLHCMAIVTHNDHRGKGLFTTLAQQTIDRAREMGYRFIIGVANGNSTHGFVDKLGFSYITSLEVKMGFGTDISPRTDNMTRKYWDKDLFNWRLGCESQNYMRKGNALVGHYNRVVQTFMGTFGEDLLHDTETTTSLLPKLYVGTGAKFGSHYLKVPKFVKHSPFNLIFLDLTDGKTPAPDKDNIFFQLFDFDVV